MSVSQDWVEALHINPEKLNEWSALAPDGVPLIVWLLQEGHVSPGAYLDWAKEHYQLPVVSPEYFTDAFDPSSARDLQVHFDLEWRPWFFPVESWDGITLVACVTPPEHIPANARFILADPATLQNVWSLLASTVTATSFKMPPIPSLENSDEQLPPALPDIPEGLTNAGTKPFTLNLDLDQLGAPAEPPPMPEAPEGLKATPPEFKLDLPDFPSDEPVAQVPEPVPMRAAPVQPEIPPPTPQERMNDDLSVVKVPSIAAKAEAVKAKAKPGAAGKKVSSLEQDALIDEAFVKLKKIYQHCFLMKCTDATAKLYRWDDSLNPANDGKSVSIDLAFPTFFRIIYKTQLPYHGYLVDSPAHRDFFSELQITDLPGCVTGIPLRDGNQLVGVLVCVGAEELQKLDVLKKVEEAVAPVVESLTQSWVKAA
jgi:hypothetical protein